MNQLSTNQCLRKSEGLCLFLLIYIYYMYDNIYIYDYICTYLYLYTTCRYCPCQLGRSVSCHLMPLIIATYRGLTSLERYRTAACSFFRTSMAAWLQPRFTRDCLPPFRACCESRGPGSRNCFVAESNSTAFPISRNSLSRLSC